MSPSFPFRPLRPLLSLAVLLGAGVTFCQAGEPEHRTFAVTASDAPAGEYRMTITTSDDGSVTMTSDSDVQIRHFLGTYRYTYHGSETWKDGKLIKLDASCNDNGKKHSVSATPGPQGLSVTADGKRSVAGPNVLTSTYWHLPMNHRKPQVPVLNTDTGEVRATPMQEIGPARLTVGGQAVECSHWRSNGKIPTDLWYDKAGRLVREEWTSSGYHMVLHLTQMPQ